MVSHRKRALRGADAEQKANREGVQARGEEDTPRNQNDGRVHRAALVFRGTAISG